MYINASNYEDVLGRYHQFYDGVVVEIRLLMHGQAGCLVTIECMDRNAASGWSRVSLEIKEVSQFKFQYGKTTFEVLSSGLQFMWRGGLVTVFLDAYPDDEGFPDLGGNNAYIVGRQCRIINLGSL